MPRTRRLTPGGYVFHVLNRGNGRMLIFEDDADYAAFEKLLADAVARFNMRLIAYCLMPNHWHLVLWPREDGDLAGFMHWLTTTHVSRWRTHRHTLGEGHLYQGPYKSFPVEEDVHCVNLCRYVERNARRANLVKRAENWRWCSLWRRLHRESAGDGLVLAEWPVDRPRNWVERVNLPETPQELEAIRRSIHRGTPMGDESWQKRVGKTLELESTLRPRGRPKKHA